MVSGGPLTRHGHEALLPRVLELRSDFGAYDACYMALAEQSGAALLTADDRLARAVQTHTAVAVLPSDGASRQQVGHPLVIGCGNPLRRDDGVGVRVAELLAEDPRFGGVDVLAVHQLTPELAVDIGACSLVVFIDADVSAEPGAVTVRSLEVPSPPSAVGPGPASHHVSATQILALAELLYGQAPRAFAVSVGVADLEMGEGLSAVVEASLPEIVDSVARLVAR